MGDRKHAGSGTSAYRLVSETMFLILTFGSLVLFLILAFFVWSLSTTWLPRIIILGPLTVVYIILVLVFYHANRYVKNRF